MGAIINRLMEIEETASSIVEHAREQKALLDQEYAEKSRCFDEELEKKTEERLRAIQEKLSRKTSQTLSGQNGTGDKAIQALRQEYEERHAEYARAIVDRITEV